MNKEKGWKKVKNQDSMGKTTFFLAPCPSTLGQFSHIAACHSSSENTRQMNLKPILNKTSPWAHMESELDILGVSGKLVKYVVHLSKRKNWKKNIFLHTSCPNSNRLVSWSQGILGVIRTLLIYIKIPLNTHKCHWKAWKHHQNTLNYPWNTFKHHSNTLKFLRTP
jgi:hypothetical protein